MIASALDSVVRQTERTIEVCTPELDLICETEYHRRYNKTFAEAGLRTTDLTTIRGVVGVFEEVREVRIPLGCLRVKAKDVASVRRPVRGVAVSVVGGWGA